MSNLLSRLRPEGRTSQLAETAPSLESILQQLLKTRGKLPHRYLKTFHEPLWDALNRLGASGLDDIRSRDPEFRNLARLLHDACMAAEAFDNPLLEAPTRAVLQFINDLYDGFLSSEDRYGIKPPDHVPELPMVCWCVGIGGPYVFSADATAVLGLKNALIVLPENLATMDLADWSLIPHEAAGHDLLQADDGLLGELRNAIFSRVYAQLIEKGTKKPVARDVARYWSDMTNEIAADAMAVLNMGPATAIGIAASLFNDKQRRRAGSYSSELHAETHPPPYLRVRLLAELVGGCDFRSAERWRMEIFRLLKPHDDKRSSIAGHPSDAATARSAAGLVASAILWTRFASLGGSPLAAVQRWRDDDEDRVERLCQLHFAPQKKRVQKIDKVDRKFLNDGRTYAAHVVAAATLSVSAGQCSQRAAHSKMIELLCGLYARDPAWGSLEVKSPGDVAIQFGKGGTSPSIPGIFGKSGKSVAAKKLPGSGHSPHPPGGGTSPGGPPVF